MGALTVPAIASAQTLLYLGGPDSPPTFTTYVGRLGNIDFAGVQIDMVDVSNQESVAHRMLGTLLKSGDLNAVLYWEPIIAQDQALFGLVIEAPPQLQAWKLVWPDGTEWLFNGYLTKFTPKADIGKALEASITISIDDQITPVYA